MQRPRHDDHKLYSYVANTLMVDSDVCMARCAEATTARIDVANDKLR